MGNRRRYVVVLALLMSMLVANLAVGQPAWANHLRRGAKTSQVGDVFHGPVPPGHIDCLWVHKSGGSQPHSYRCSGKNGYKQFLSTPDGQGGLLQADRNPPSYRVANPNRFQCDGAGGATTPSGWKCSYNRNGKKHEFRLDEMVIMTDPDPNDPKYQGRPQVIYAWPPEK
jgi:hypothetical protein